MLIFLTVNPRSLVAWATLLIALTKAAWRREDFNSLGISGTHTETEIHHWTGCLALLLVLLLVLPQKIY